MRFLAPTSTRRLAAASALLLAASVAGQSPEPVKRVPRIHHEGQWYVAALCPELDGIRIARLVWDLAE